MESNRAGNRCVPNVSLEEDVRWIQRFEQYKKALSNLSDAVDLSKKRELSRLEQQGLIKGFELVHELSWIIIKDFYEAQGEVSIQGSKDAFRLAFKRGLIENGQLFMKSIKSRQLSVHTYNEETAKEIQDDVVEQYYHQFEKLRIKFQLLKERA